MRRGRTGYRSDVATHQSGDVRGAIRQDPVKARVALPAADPPDHAIDGDRVADLQGGRPAVLRLPHGFADVARAGRRKSPTHHESRTPPERMGSERHA
ncbi:MAG: hypothetical protein EKK43_04975 [Methylobacterium sp.]|nr:MAG: hypothetical protein EKK43_04975 [Methylobacterium sp.]